MTFDMKVKNRPNDNSWTFVQQFTSPEDAQRVRSLCKNNIWGRLSSQFVPVRTDKQHLVKDLFVPAWSQNAIKINSAGLKIFARIAELFLDLFTLPFRALTVIPRAIYNHYHPKEKDPFYLYLQSHNSRHELTTVLRLDAAFVMFNWVETDSSGQRHQRQECKSVAFTPQHVSQALSFAFTGSNPLRA